LNCDQRS